MAYLKVAALRSMLEGMGPERTVQELREALESKQLKPEDFSLRRLAEGLVRDKRSGEVLGRDFTEALDPRQAGSAHSLTVLEAVDSTAFKQISGQLIITRLLDAYNSPAFIGDQLCTTVPTEFDGEKIPGITGLGDQAQQVDELKPYPSAAVGPDWIATPHTLKHGLKVEVSKEAVFFDRTGRLLMQAQKVGESLGLHKEKRILDMVLGVTNNYKWRDTAYDTYQTSSPWDNVTASNGLENWTDIEAMLATFAALIDPATEEPIVMIPNTIWCHTSNRATANYILNATQVKVDPNISAGTMQHQMYVPNSQLVGQYNVLASPTMDARYTAGSVTTTDWFMGDPKAAFAYMENWPITVVPMPENNYEAWDRDVVAGWKASERGTVAVLEPRKAGKSTA